MSAFPGSESEIAMLAERLREETRGRYGLTARHSAGDGYVEFDGLQVPIDRRVTLRVVRGPQPDSLPSSERVRALMRLSHPHILPVLDLIELDDLLVAVTPCADDKGAWWTTRLLDGVSPDDAERWIGTALRVVREAATALAYAHGKGIVHGGLRPECVKFSDGSVCIGGFLAGDVSGEWTPFVSPEQQAGAVATAAGDQYALGVLAYALLTGELPFTDAEGQRRGASRTPLAGLGRVPGDAIVRMIAYSADDRFASMDDVILAFADVTEQRPKAGDAVGALDENVQFTVYRPSVVQPAKWYPMLAFAHLTEARAGSAEPDPVVVVERQAKQILEDAIGDYKQIVEDSAQPIPREGTITFVPEMAGIEFNPPRQSFEWVESVHRVEFRLRAAPSLDGKTARGRLTVYHGVIILADLTLSIKVDRAPRTQLPVSGEPPVKARPYRKIFASYSHKDVDIVRQFERFAATLGDSYLRDSRDIRAGEVWSDRLQELMREADIVQLFWSWNAMVSPFVRQEWEYALSLGRPNFIRPTYWEDPMPASPDGSLPTPELLRLQFQRIAASRSEFELEVGRSRHTPPEGVEAWHSPREIGMSERSIPPTPMGSRDPGPSEFTRMMRTSSPSPTVSLPAPRTPVSAAPSIPASATPSKGRRWRMATRISTTVAALGFVGISLLTTKLWMPASSAPQVAVGGTPDTVIVPGGGAPPVVVGKRDTIRYSPAPPPPPPTNTEAPVAKPSVIATLREVTAAYQRDSVTASQKFDRQEVVIDVADSAKVIFARRVDQALLRTDSTESRQLVCRIGGTQSGRLLVRDCRRALRHP